MTHRWMLAAASLSILLLAACSEDGTPPPATLVATADTVVAAPGATADLLANDTYNGSAASAGSTGNVVFSTAGATLPTGVTVVDGTVTIAADAPPTSATFSYQICDAKVSSDCGTATVTLSVLRNVTGTLVAPQLIAATTQAAMVRVRAARPTTRAAAAHAVPAHVAPADVASGCPDVPTNYEPLASVTVTPLRADGSVAGATFTTDACGGFTATVPPDTVTLSIAATATLQAQTFDVTTFTSAASTASALPIGSSYEISNLYFLDTNRVGMSVSDSITNKAVIGLPASAVTVAIGGVSTTLAAFSASLNTSASTTGLVMDASGSMSTVVYTDPTSNQPFDRFALASIAAGEFINGKQAGDEVAMVVFDNAVNLIDDAFLAGLSFVSATTSAPLTVTIGADGFTTDGSDLLTVANLYNGDSAIYEHCYSGGALLSTCFPYVTQSDASIRLTSAYPWSGDTALWAATDLALDKVNARANKIKFIVAMTDGQDNASGANTSTTVIAKATQFHIPISMVAFGTASSVNETEMQKVAADTGGSYYRQESQGIIGIFQAIQTGIRFQYTATLGVPALASGQVVTVSIGTQTRDLTIP